MVTGFPADDPRRMAEPEDGTSPVSRFTFYVSRESAAFRTLCFRSWLPFAWKQDILADQ
jgi:hypothetical protein